MSGDEEDAEILEREVLNGRRAIPCGCILACTEEYPTRPWMYSTFVCKWCGGHYHQQVAKWIDKAGREVRFTELIYAFREVAVEYPGGPAVEEMGLVGRYGHLISVSGELTYIDYSLRRLPEFVPGRVVLRKLFNCESPCSTQLHREPL